MIHPGGAADNDAVTLVVTNDGELEVAANLMSRHN